MNLELIAKKTLLLVQETGLWLLEQRVHFDEAKIEEKSAHNLVTSVDKGSEERLVEGLSNILPESGFIAEEGTSVKKGEIYNWIIDPIDGTTNFVHNIPAYCISIALQQQDETVLGIVYAPVTNEMFYSWKGAGAVFLNEKEIQVSPEQNMDKVLMATGFPYATYQKTDELFQIYKWFITHSRGVRRLGSAALDLAYVAVGRFEGFYEWGLSPWDVAAGAFLVQQAGGQVSDFDGDASYLINQNGIVASNKHIHEDVLKVLCKHLK